MGLAYIWEISKNWRKMKNVRILLKLGGDLLWFIKQHCTKQEVSISKTLALRAFSIFLILWIFLSLSHKSGPHYEKNETCPDFAQTWWGPSLGYYKTKLFLAGSLYLKNPGSESILHFLILRIFLSLSHKSGPHYEKNETCPDFAQTWWGPSLVHKTTLYQTGSLYLKNPGSESILHFSPFLHFSISQISISQISKKLRKMKNIRILLKLGGDLL